MSPRSLASAPADTLSDGGWRAKARPSQLPPPGQWKGWIRNCGRGEGKTWSAANFTNELAETGEAGRIALIGATAADVRDTMVEGPSGLLQQAPNWFRPRYEPSKRRLEWPNGATAHAFSAEEADRLRGPQHDFGWCDEFAAWQNARDAWDMFQFGLRLGAHPRWVITTTPRPLKILRALMAQPDVVVTTGSTFDNAANLAPSFLDAIRARCEGTRIGRQELSAELLEDVPGALWTRDMLERCRYNGALSDMKRIVVAIDPSGTKGEEDSGDSIGIVVAGLGMDGFGYVLADKTVKASPAVWGAVAVKAYRDFKADRIIGERNFGGAMIEHVIRTVDPNVPYRDVVASRGKVARAEPVAALYEQNRVRHVGAFTQLEDQMAAMTGNGYAGGGGSPDRVDALVWALSELMTGPATPMAAFGVYTAYAPRPTLSRFDGPITDKNDSLFGGYAVSR